MIPPMFAQPFIENALEHGISGLKVKGEITIEFLDAEDKVKLTIRDNGKVLEINSQNDDNSPSLATKITKERIDRITKLGGQAELVLETLYNDDKQAMGTLVTLLLPVKKIN